MLNKKEITAILLATLIIAFASTLIETWNFFLTALLSVFILIIANTAAKKIAGYYFESEIEVGLWEFRRWGYKKHHKFKKPFPAGAFFPIISKIIFFPIHGFVWMASLVFDVKSKVYRAAKRHGIYSFFEVNELHIGIIAAAGIIINLILAFAGYLLDFTFFGKLNVWYAFFNILPLSNLDGTKIYFGSRTIWTILFVIVLIALGYSFFLA